MVTIKNSFLNQHVSVHNSSTFKLEQNYVRSCQNPLYVTMHNYWHQEAYDFIALSSSFCGVNFDLNPF